MVTIIQNSLPFIFYYFFFDYLLFYYFIILLFYYFIILLFYYFIILLFYYFIILLVFIQLLWVSLNCIWIPFDSIEFF